MSSSQTIQLLTHEDPPQWWARLSGLKDLSECRWTVSADFTADADVVLLSRRELELRFGKEALSPSKVYVLFDENWTVQNLRRSLSALRGALFFDSAGSTEDSKRVLQLALSRQAERARQTELMHLMRTQSRQIDEVNRDLERVMKERVAAEAESRKASQKNISRVREIISFIKDLAQLFEIGDLLPLLRRQIKEYHGLEAPILFVPRGEQNGDIYYLRGSESVRSRLRGTWKGSSRIQVNQTEDSRFLANSLGRPFGKVIRIPLITGRHQSDADRAPVLFFPHTLDETQIDAVLADLSEKLQPVSWALDRLILEQELKNTSRNWEMTFDELPEPIAIIDHDGTVLRSNSHWSDELTTALKDARDRIRLGEKYFVVERYPIRVSADSRPLSWVVYLRDETKSWKLKSQMVQVEKMSAVGQLAGHVAHELNNPLTGIRSLAQVLLTEVEDESQIANDLNEVERAAARCQGIINNLLDFSKGAIEQKIHVMDLNEVVRRTLPFLKSALGRLRTDVELCEESLPVRIEPHLLQQVIFNLINNACQAVSPSGEIKIRTLKRGDRAILEVEDDGPGVPEELRERIFEPFFTTKSEGEGTGLGLSFSREFVRGFGGDLRCEPKTTPGAVFRVELKMEPQS